MKKFRCIVTKETTMEVEIDESVWAEKEIAEWQRCFYSAENLMDIVKHIARLKTEYEDGEFIEGFGIPLINGEKPYDYLEDKNIATDINICSENSEVYIDVDEIFHYGHNFKK